MLHEHEPGAWDFARELRARGVPLDAIPLAPTSTRSRSCGSPAYLGRTRPTILHTHLVHADVYGQLTGALTRLPVRVLDEARLQRVPREPRLRARRPRDREPRAHAHRDLARARALPRGGRGLRRRELRDRPLRDRAGRRAAAVRGRRAAAAVRRAPDPDQGSHRPAARVRRGAQQRCRTSSSTSPGAARSSRRCARSRRSSASRTPCASSATSRRCSARSRSAAVVVVPSMGEGFGMVALEAMERARPVIAAEIGGLGELVEDGVTGFLVPPGEAEPLADAIVRLAADLEPGGRDGRARAAAVRWSSFLQERCTERTELLYRAARLLVDRQRPRSAMRRDGELAPARARGRGRRGRAGSRQHAVDAPRERRRIVRRHEDARLAVDDELRQRADVASRRPAGRRASPRARRGRSPPSAPDGRAVSRGAATRRRPERGRAGSTGRRARARALRAPRARGPRRARRDARPSIRRGSARIATSTPFCGSSRQTASSTRASAGHRVRRVRAPRLRAGRRARSGSPRPSSAGRPTRSTWNRASALGDRDDARRAPRERRARRTGTRRCETDRRCASSRRAAVRRARRTRRRARGACARRPRRARRARRASERRVDVARRRQRARTARSARRRTVRRPRRVVEPEEAHVDAALRERRQQRQQVPLRAADAADPVDVEDLHARARRRPNSRSNTAAASSASRKSVATR